MVERLKDITPKGVTLEDAALRHAETIRGEMPKQKKKIFTKEEKDFYFHIPSLAWEYFEGEEEDIPRWIPKYFPVSGIPVISRFRNRVLDPQVMKKGIESGIRQQGKIKKQYLEEEKKRIDELSKGMLELSMDLRGKGITQEKLDEAKKKTQELFTSLKITKPVDPLFKGILEMGEKAGERDRVGRINTLKSRTQFRSAFWKGIKREVITKLVAEKSSNIHLFLLLEREDTRACLMNASDSLLNLEIDYQFSVEKTGELSDEEKEDFYQEAIDIVYDYLRPIRAYPYLGVARLMEYLLLPKEDRHYDIENTLSYYYGFEDPSFWEAIGKEKSVVELINEGAPKSEVVKQLILIREKADNLLTNPKYLDITPEQK